MEPHSVDVLLVGGGVAAARCARTLRRRGFAGSVLLVSDEPTPPYNRPPLSKELLQADLPAELALVEPLSWYERHAVQLLLGERVLTLDPDGRHATLVDGSLIEYGQCLIATGAAPRLPAIPGARTALPLRTLDDSARIRARATAGSRAVVIGGGFIGVEVAGSLAARGVSVTIVEVAGALWGGAFGPEVGAWAAERLTAAGVELRLGAACESITDSGVRLADGELDADFVVAGVGVTPRVELAVVAGMDVDNGILVDDGQRTSAPGIFAAGDVARPRDGARVEHWHAARESGERAALAMLGQPLPVRRAPWVYSEFAGAKLDVVGWAPRWDSIVALQGVVGYVVAGTVAQVAALDSAVPIEGARTLVEQSPTPAELRSLVDGHNLAASNVQPAP
ncbi:MAG TPA: FAD-dependent oxidoreductase [Candidatus Limnocylindria bacterium]|nr:FAD-dependent oxidoreductase [Candidatus Limnocylindria bacterium]